MKKMLIIVIVVAMLLLLCSSSATILLGRFELNVYYGEEKVLSKQYKIKTTTMMTTLFKYNGNFYEFYQNNREREDVKSFSCFNEEMQKDINGIIEQIEKPYENSQLQWDKQKAEFIYIDGKDGIKVNKNMLTEEIYKNLSSRAEVHILTDIDKRKINKEMLYEKAFERAKFRTSFSKSIPARKHNIEVATKRISGQRIEPGESLSFNKVVGRRTEENGFKTAKIISKGVFVDGVGGGVCQVSTTLYNAWIKAGLEAVHAVNHSLPVSYVPPSFDAMVSSKNDLVLLNNTNSDIFIKSFTEDDNIEIIIYGVKTNERVELRNKIIRRIPCCEYDEIEIKFDWKEGETARILAQPKEGMVSVAYKDIYIGNNLIETKKLRTNTYLPQKGRIARRKIDEAEKNVVYSNLYNLINDNTGLCVKKIVSQI